MDDDYEESLKQAVFTKVQKVGHLINEITIGPQSIKKLSLKNKSPATSTPKRISPNKVEKKTPTSSPVIEQGLPTRQFLKLLDLERQEQVQNALNERLLRFEQFSKAQEQQSKQSWLRTQQNFIEDMERQEMYILQVNQQFDLKQSSQQAKVDQLTQNALQRMKQREDLLKERQRQRQVLNEQITKIKSNQQKFSSEFQQILGLLKTCADSAELKTSKELDFSLLRSLPAEIEAVLEKFKGDNFTTITDKDAQKSDDVVRKIIEFKSKFKSVVDGINNRKAQQQQQVQQQQSVKAQEKEVQQNIVASTVTAVAPANTTVAPVKMSEGTKASNLNKLSKYVNIKDLQLYEELMAFHEQFKMSFSQLENDQSLKTYKFDLKKAINIPVNALSGVNSEHIMDKYIKLHRLLTGHSVSVSNKEINAGRHPQGIAFCMDLLARKFVLQGDLMVSSSPESAFCYASVILSLWNDFPDFGKLLMVYFYKMCPYLVPYYIPKQVGESDEEFYKKLGYQYSEGEVEKQDKFLKRMTGIMKLHFTLMISKPKKGQNSSPYNIKSGWKWLASFLRLEPQLDISATALHAFLETVGFEMDGRYGKAFQKVLTVIIQVFLQKCKEVKCTGGAVTRLELLLTEYLKNRKFEAPHGYLAYAYW